MLKQKFKVWYELLRWLSGEEPTLPMQETDLIPRLGGSPGEGNGNPLWYFCPGNRIDRGTWWATIHGVAKESDTAKWLKNDV